MKRRANNEGNVRQRADGRWEARISQPNGTRKSVFAPTQREVLEKLRAETSAVADGLPIASGRNSVGEYLTTWLEGARPRLRPRVAIRYEQFIRTHAAGIARIQLAKLGPQDLERLYAERLKAGAAPMTVRHVHALLHKALKQAA